jgi:hypothetical protein
VHDFLAMGPDLVKADTTAEKVQFFFNVNGVVVVAARRQDSKHRCMFGSSCVCALRYINFFFFGHRELSSLFGSIAKLCLEHSSLRYVVPWLDGAPSLMCI